MRLAIHSALDKDPEKRPQRAEAFASLLRSRSEGILGLLRRALVIYSEHLPKFLMLTTFFSLPIIVLTLTMVALAFLKISGVLSENTATGVSGLVGIMLSFVGVFCTNLIVGTNAWMVTHYFSVPLRPLRLRPALAEARRKWKIIAGSGAMTAILPFVVAGIAGFGAFIAFFVLGLLFYPLTGSIAGAAIAGAAAASLACIAGFFAAYTSWMLVPAIVMLENVRIIEALKRSRALVRRSISTTLGAVFIILLIPALIAGLITGIVTLGGKALAPDSQSGPAAAEKAVDDEASGTSAAADGKKGGVNFSFGKEAKVTFSDQKQNMASRVKSAVLESLIQVLWLPIQILGVSFSAIIVALLYLKTRLAGGESMNDLIERFEDEDRPRKKWQERVRRRLIQSGRLPSKP
jgi:hypothetical protein